ncbi:MAG: hypothetical protein K2K25_10875 [Muribaculaceae bacterium]|nr:hypothetical protein [Muribaculaceae bacterium]
MKEKDLEKCLDNLIIKGLIQEAEQDNAEFETAMRNMSDEDFLSLIYDTEEKPQIAAWEMKRDTVLNDNFVMSESHHVANRMSNIAFGAAYDWDELDEEPAIAPHTEIPATRQKNWKIWAGAIASVAAILLIIFIPVSRSINTRLCDSALLASEAYTTHSRGLEISSMQKDEVEDILPKLEKQYSVSKHSHNGILYEQAPETENSDYYLDNFNTQEAGMDLVKAYLKLGMKDKAVEVLKELAESDADPDFIDYCKKMLEILE